MEGIPQFAEPLAPYLKSLEEALRMRRVLTLYLLNQLRSADDAAPGHFSASTGHNVDSVKGIPSELGNGNYARYLKALQANINAGNEYDKTCQELSALKRRTQSSSTKHGASPRTEELQSYLSLLRARQEREKVQILQQYLEKLSSMEAAQPDYLTAGEWTKPSDLSPNADSASGSSSETVLPGSCSNVESLLRHLERSVLRAKHKLDDERRKLAQASLAMKQRNLPANATAVSASVRYNALRRVRDELVRWVEGALASVAAAEEDSGPREHPTDQKREDAPISLDDKKLRIQKQYEAYLAARQALLDAVADASRPLPPVESANLPSQSSISLESAGATVVEPPALLTYVDRNLLPLSKAPKAAAAQRSYVSAILAKQKGETCKVLGRLQEESHLLPEYPIVAKQARFRHAVAAISGRRASVAPAPESNPTSEVMDHAEAWAFASSAAGDATSEYVGQKVSEGARSAKSAEDILRDIYATMNREYGATAAPGDEDNRAEEDRTRSRQVGESGYGPWSRLRGTVGMTEDG
jgi:hypothetical protein